MCCVALPCLFDLACFFLLPSHLSLKTCIFVNIAETSAGNDYDFTLSADNAELIVTCPLEYTNFTGCAVICRYNNDNRLQTFAFSKGIGFPQYIHLPPGSYGCGVVGFISGQAVHSIVLLRPYTLNGEYTYIIRMYTCTCTCW